MRRPQNRTAALLAAFGCALAYLPTGRVLAAVCAALPLSAAGQSFALHCAAAPLAEELVFRGVGAGAAAAAGTPGGSVRAGGAVCGAARRSGRNRLCGWCWGCCWEPSGSAPAAYGPGWALHTLNNLLVFAAG